MSYARQEIVATLRRTGYPELADEAERELPDQVDLEQVQAFLRPHGVTKDDIISGMGGSP
jgi:hypothetical protein